MKYTPSRGAALALLGTTLMTALLMLACGKQVLAPGGCLCSVNDYFIEHALHPLHAAIAICIGQIPGLLIFMACNYLSSRDPQHINTYRTILVSNQKISICDLLSRTQRKAWGRPLYILICLNYTLNFMTVKAGSAITGVALGVVIYLHFNWQPDYWQLVRIAGLAYIVSIFPNYIHWRIVRKSSYGDNPSSDSPAC
jgi:hypothetical protein